MERKGLSLVVDVMLLPCLVCILRPESRLIIAGLGGPISLESDASD